MLVALVVVYYNRQMRHAWYGPVIIILYYYTRGHVVSNMPFFVNLNKLIKWTKVIKFS